jgi:hypothetical protein
MSAVVHVQKTSAIRPGQGLALGRRMVSNTVPVPFPSTTTTNRRDSFRAPLSGTVTLTARGRLVDAAALDVSEGGLRLLSRLALVVGDPVAIVFFVNGELVSVNGVVRWLASTRHGFFTFGIRFASVEDDGVALLSTYCRRAMS